jgi:hypothetical protein
MESIMRRDTAVFTLTPEERAAYKEEMRTKLIETARARQTIAYSELAATMQTVYLHPHSFTFSNILRQVCHEEFDKGHGELCALVVSKITGMPSGGYFKSMEPIKGEDGEILDIESQWRTEMEATFEYWSDK